MAVPAVFRKYNEISLIKRILIGLVIGIVLALLIPNVQPWTDVITLLGSLFVGALKAVAPVLVFFLVISALCNAEGAGTMKTVVVLYVVSTLVAAIVALIGSELFPSNLTLDTSSLVEQAAPEGIGEVLTTLLMNIVANPVDALMNANYVGILAWAVVLGIALRAAGERTKEVFTAISDAVSKAVRWVINLAPFGILGLVYTSVSTSGMDIFIEYGHLILVLVACMLVIALVTNPLIVWVCTRKNPYPLVLRCLKDSGLTAFFTRSSAANIPVNMELCRKLGLNKDNYSVSIPLGATINMAGAAVDHHLSDHHHGHDHGRLPDHRPGCGPGHRRHPLRAGRRVRLRRLRRGRRVAATHPHVLRPVRHHQRHRHAGGGYRLHHRRHPGFLRDRSELLFRRGVHGYCRVPPAHQGGQGSAPRPGRLLCRRAGLVPRTTYGPSPRESAEAGSLFLCRPMRERAAALTAFAERAAPSFPRG